MHSRTFEPGRPGRRWAGAAAHVVGIVSLGFLASFALITADQVVHQDVGDFTLTYLSSSAVLGVGAYLLYRLREGRVDRGLRAAARGLTSAEPLGDHLASRDLAAHSQADLDLLARGLWHFALADERALRLHAVVREELDRRERRANGRLTLAFALLAFLFAMLTYSGYQVIPWRERATEEDCDGGECPDGAGDRAGLEHLREGEVRSLTQSS